MNDAYNVVVFFHMFSSSFSRLDKYTLQKKKFDIDFQSSITKLVDMIKTTKNQDAMERGLICACPK